MIFTSFFRISGRQAHKGTIQELKIFRIRPFGGTGQLATIASRKVAKGYFHMGVVIPLRKGNLYRCITKDVKGAFLKIRGAEGFHPPLGKGNGFLGNAQPVGVQLFIVVGVVKDGDGIPSIGQVRPPKGMIGRIGSDTAISKIFVEL